MRNLFLVFVIFNVWANYAQTTNRTCEAAEFICAHGPYSQEFEGNETPCVGPIEPLYYAFNFTAVITNSIEIPEGTTTGSYIFYGPFTGELLEACEQINLNAAQAVYGNFGIGAGLQTLGNQIGFYILRVLPDQCEGVMKITVTADAGFGCESEVNCAECVTSFSPSAGKYMVSAWVKESGAPYSTINYSNSSLEIYFTGDPSTYSLIPSGQIIDGWQRIEGIIDIPAGATDLSIAFTVSSGISYFDDIRFFPFDGSMMSYVYDPLSLRLMAELDERNYATLYEYDEEGKLIRVKKETERGIMTIQENRDNIVKQ